MWLLGQQNHVVTTSRKCHILALQQCDYGVGKFEHPSIQKEGLRHQNHAAMNAQVLNNLLTWFCHNEQKEIVKAKRHANLK
jgi:hypothetical protein